MQWDGRRQVLEIGMGDLELVEDAVEMIHINQRRRMVSPYSGMVGRFQRWGWVIWNRERKRWKWHTSPWYPTSILGAHEWEVSIIHILSNIMRMFMVPLGGRTGPTFAQTVQRSHTKG
jgi:hypothetical protein